MGKQLRKLKFMMRYLNLSDFRNVIAMTDKTLDAWVKRTYRSSFSEAFGQKRSTGRISLRKSQFRTARSNPFMIASRNVL